MIRFVDGDYENARKDLEIAEQNRKENPYVAVWRYMTAAALKDEKALVDAKSYLARQKRLDLWPIPVLNVVEGSVKVEELLKASEFEGNRIAQKERAAEANFYLAMLAQLKGDKAEREKYLKASIEQSSPRVHEATLAKVMLEGWKTPVPEPPKSVNQDASPAPPKPVEPKKVD
jgi:lipoprotein NlpI